MQVTYGMTGDYASITMQFAAGSFPADATSGPVAAVFVPSSVRRVGIAAAEDQSARRAAVDTVKAVVGPYLNLGPSAIRLSSPMVVSLTFDAKQDYGNLAIAGAQLNLTSNEWEILEYQPRAEGSVDYNTGIVFALATSFHGPLAAVSYQPAPGTLDRAVQTQTPPKVAEKVLIPDIELWAKITIGIGSIIFFFMCVGVYLACCASFSSMRLFGIDDKEKDGDHLDDKDDEAAVHDGDAGKLMHGPMGTTSMLERQAVITKHFQDFGELIDEEAAHAMVLDHRAEPTEEEKKAARAERRRKHKEKKERNVVRAAKKLGIDLDGAASLHSAGVPGKIEKESTLNIGADMVFADGAPLPVLDAKQPTIMGDDGIQATANTQQSSASSPAHVAREQRRKVTVGDGPRSDDS